MWEKCGEERGSSSSASTIAVSPGSSLSEQFSVEDDSPEKREGDCDKQASLSSPVCFLIGCLMAIICTWQSWSRIQLQKSAQAASPDATPRQHSFNDAVCLIISGIVVLTVVWSKFASDLPAFTESAARTATPKDIHVDAFTVIPRDMKDVHVDDCTVIPSDLHMGLLKAGQLARQRGQHQLSHGRLTLCHAFG